MHDRHFEQLLVGVVAKTPRMRFAPPPPPAPRVFWYLGEDRPADLYFQQLLVGVVAQPPSKLIPASIAQHHSILGSKGPLDVEDASSKQGLAVLLDCCHCAAVQPQLSLHWYTQDPPFPVPACITNMHFISSAVCKDFPHGCQCESVSARRVAGLALQASGILQGLTVIKPTQSPTARNAFVQAW